MILWVVVYIKCVADPVKEDRTIYDAFNASDGPTEKNVRPSAGDAGGKKGAQVSKKKKPEQNGKHVLKPLPVDEALAKVYWTKYL